MANPYSDRIAPIRCSIIDYAIHTHKCPYKKRDTFYYLAAHTMSSMFMQQSTVTLNVDCCIYPLSLSSYSSHLVDPQDSIVLYVSYKKTSSKPKLYSLKKVLTILALEIKIRRTHLVIELSSQHKHLAPIRSSLHVLQGKWRTLRKDFRLELSVATLYSWLQNS